MTVGEQRPDPQNLLHTLHKQQEQERCGKLKIFFGYAAGVGKTYTMLEAAHQAKRNGVDVVVGYVERHIRPDTLAPARRTRAAAMPGGGIQGRHPEGI